MTEKDRMCQLLDAGLSVEGVRVGKSALTILRRDGEGHGTEVSDSMLPRKASRERSSARTANRHR